MVDLHPSCMPDVINKV